MGQFFKIFFASLLAIVVFIVLSFFVLAGIGASMSSSSKPETGSKAVLYIDLNQTFSEQAQDNPLATFNKEDEAPGLYQAVRIINHAKTDSAVKGIYINCSNNNNGFATSEELRMALLDFKTSKKFIYAYGDVIPQKAYYIANVADKIYCNPKGGIDWKGYSIKYMFFKQALDKLEIEPQIFYAGKFKSATEPLRTDRMSDANRLQSQELLNDLYNRLLTETAQARNIDTATLHKCANELLIQSASDAVQYKLADGAKYDDEVKDELKQKLQLDKKTKINFISLGKYVKTVDALNGTGSNKIALIYAEGNIVDGKGSKTDIGGDTYRSLIRKARLDDDVKAIVIRVNSGGGSAMASEIMWRELSIAKKEKPIVLSFGDYAASGGYYMSCGADSIFAMPNTLTGSIGVFSIIPNLQKFFNNKIGVTFDGVKTAQYADMASANRPLTEMEKKFLQGDVDSIYHTFLTRVANGRKMTIASVDSIAQGRVWTGTRAVQLGLVDRLGNLQNAIDCAAGMAKLKEYRLKEYPEKTTWWESLFNGNYRKNEKAKAIKEELGEEGFILYNSLKKIKTVVNGSQARLPFDMIIE